MSKSLKVVKGYYHREGHPGRGTNEKALRQAMTSGNEQLGGSMADRVREGGKKGIQEQATGKQIW